jgi:hypothetical protein
MMSSSIIKVGDDATTRTQDFDLIQLEGVQYDLTGVRWRPKNESSKLAWKPQDNLSCTRVRRKWVHRSE